MQQCCEVGYRTTNIGCWVEEEMSGPAELRLTATSGRPKSPKRRGARARKEQAQCRNSRAQRCNDTGYLNARASWFAADADLQLFVGVVFCCEANGRRREKSMENKKSGRRASVGGQMGGGYGKKAGASRLSKQKDACHRPTID